MFKTPDKKSRLKQEELIDKATTVLRNTPAEVFSEEQLLNLWSVISSKDDEVFDSKFASSQIIDKSIGLLDMQDGCEYSDEQLSRIVGLLKRKGEEHQESRPRYVVKSSPFNEGTWGVIDRIETAETDLENYWVADKLTKEQATAIAETLNEQKGKQQDYKNIWVVKESEPTLPYSHYVSDTRKPGGNYIAKGSNREALEVIADALNKYEANNE